MTAIAPYTTTFTGRHVGIENTEYPSILDIAIGLSRIVRFGGQGKEFYTVLSHSLMMDDLYREIAGAHAQEKVRLAILLHDASEAVFSDIPSPMKSLDMKKIQHGLDARVFDAYYHRYGGYEAFCDREGDAYKVVKDLDYQALLAEYWTVGPAKPCYLDQPQEKTKEFFEKWRHTNAYIDGEKFAMHGSVDPAGRMGVRKYINRVIRLL